ncbi:MAG: Dam family site-specific DNA-(adenine-N6)-methyltransferase [Acidobacteriaceae bacterium]|jgi:DNA adenine methylase|nr:Dam family site-specific DNA-(adenine-N6)-methyltransferase [Acidobacteriaceae bacterium]
MGVVRAFRREPEIESRPVVKPPLKWAGGKRWQLPTLLPYWQAHRGRRLVEPFCGGLAVATGLVPDRALLNDVNPHVINFYRWLKKGLAIESSMENERHAYYHARERFNTLLATGKSATKEAASLFYYLNRTGYNGLCRFNSTGSFNVPFGRYKTIPYRVAFEEYRGAFKGWMFTCMDFDQLELEPTDFVYADPPYDVPFTAYSKGGFRWDDQVRTAEWLSKHTGPVILSNQATARIVDLYTSLKFELKVLAAPRRINCTGDRTSVKEVLATRNL